MILQALYEYYQRKAADPGSTIAPHGLEWKEIPYLILIDKKGNFLELQDTTEQKNTWSSKVKDVPAATVGKRQMYFGTISDMC